MSSGRVESWLLALADPLGPRGVLPEHPLRRGQPAQLIQSADDHGVLPAVVANLKKTIAQWGQDRILSAPARGKPQPEGQLPCDEISAALADANQRLLGRTAFTLMLRRQWQTLAVPLAERGIPAMVIKGPDFADRLYSHAGLRPFRDIDLLTPREARPEVESTMAQVGYQRAPQPPLKHAQEYGEETWRLADRGSSGGVEVHWNLVNSPAMRASISVEYGDLQLDAPPTGVGLPRPSPGAQLLIAAVHGAASHRFDRLQLLCDVCQAARGLAGPLDEAWLRGTAQRTGSSLALATALALSGRALGEPACQELLGRLGLPSPGWLVEGLLSPSAVLGLNTRLSTIRRQLFRELLKRR